VYATTNGAMILTPQLRWPEDYIGIQKKIWGAMDINDYLSNERNSWG